MEMVRSSKLCNHARVFPVKWMVFITYVQLKYDEKTKFCHFKSVVYTLNAPIYTWELSCHCHKHCFFRESSDNSTSSSSFNLSAPGPGLNIVPFPRNKHGSAPSSELPIHHAPGAKLVVRPRSSLSILSRTGSSFANFRANGALLLTILSKSFIDKEMGCCFGGLSQAM